MVNPDAAQVYKCLRGEFVCEDCYIFVQTHGRHSEECKGLNVEEFGYHTIRDAKSYPIQHTSLTSHIKSDLHKKTTNAGPADADINIWRVVYMSALLCIPLQSHPFMMYAGHLAGADFGKQLHGITVASKMTIVLGAIIRCMYNANSLQSTNQKYFICNLYVWLSVLHSFCDQARGRRAISVVRRRHWR